MQNGAIVLPSGRRYPFLQLPPGDPAADAEVRKLGEEIWSNTNALAKAVNLAPPVTTPGADIRTTARKDGETDVFFLANTGDEAREFTASFRVTGKQPDLWQAEDGTSRAAAVWKTAAGRTELPLRLNAHQSVFVVFQKPSPADHAVEIAAADKAAAMYAARVDEAGKVVVRSAGPCRGEIVFASGDRSRCADPAGRGVAGRVRAWSGRARPSDLS
ncbi:MAG: glycosyl hydrolase [Planctomycetota bacterium]|nr:glycosyl hydrolase [Planctomycetota bacterium]